MFVSEVKDVCALDIAILVCLTPPYSQPRSTAEDKSVFCATSEPAKALTKYRPASKYVRVQPLDSTMCRLSMGPPLTSSIGHAGQG